MTTTTDELMELAEYYAGETASDLQFRDGDSDGCRAALRTAVEILVAERDALRAAHESIATLDHTRPLLDARTISRAALKGNL